MIVKIPWLEAMAIKILVAQCYSVLSTIAQVLRKMSLKILAS